MKEKALKTQKSKRYRHVKYAIIEAIVFFASIIFFVITIKYYSPTAPFHLYILPSIAVISILCSFLHIIADIISITKYSSNIKKILNTDYPNSFCYDVTIITNTLNDIYIKNHAENLCICYVENIYGDAILYKYTLDGKVYDGRVTIDFAKKLFNCPFFEYL